MSKNILEKAVDLEKISILPNILYSKDRGVYIKENAESCHSDPLGACIIYYYSKNQKSFWSWSIGEMVQLLRDNEIPIEIDYDILASVVVLGNLNTFKTPIKGVSMMPMHAGLVRDGDSLKVVSKRNRWSRLISNNALKARAVNEILANVEAIASRHDRLVVEMTGGLDSRVILAAVMHLGLQDRIDFLTRGKSDHPDRIVAERFAHALDIDMIAGPYRAEAVNVAEFEANGSFCAGVRWLDDVSFRMINKLPGVAVLTGGMGELWRSFYSETLYYKRDLGNEFLTRPVSEENAAYVYDMLAHRKNLVKNPDAVKEAFVSQLCDHGGTLGEAIFQHYNSFRNRIHYGCATILRNQYFSSYDPLYSPSGYELGLRKDPEWQLFGQLSFELIDEMFPALNAFPLAEKEISPKFRGLAKERRFYGAGLPMSRVKTRTPIPNIRKYELDGSAANDIARQYVSENKGYLSGFMNMDKFLPLETEPDSAKAAALRRASVSPAMFMKMAVA